MDEEDTRKVSTVSVWSYPPKPGTTHPFPDDNFRVTKLCLLQAMDFAQNMNKFYIIELHAPVDTVKWGEKRRIFTHSGRTDELVTKGANAGQKEVRLVDGDFHAEKLMEQIVKEKTHPDKGYYEVHVMQPNKALGSGKAGRGGGGHTGDDDSQPSKLETQLQSLVQLIFQEASAALTAVLDVSLTPQGLETPLGVLSMEQIRKGSRVLDKLEALLSQDREPESGKVVELGCEFYSLIPHRLGIKKDQVQQHVIRDLGKLWEKRELLQSMSDMISLQLSRFNGSITASLLDRRYLSLNCRIQWCGPGSDDHEKVAHFVANSSDAEALAPNNGDKPTKIQICNVYKLERGDEGSQFTRNVRNHKLLVHGSPTANLVGLLSRGILMPQQVLSQGVATRRDFGFLGAGIYFSDHVEASVRYTTALSHSSFAKDGHPSNSRFVLLATVALGNSANTLNITKDLEKAPGGRDSVIGVSKKHEPDSQFTTAEYVVYNTNQVRLEYLVEFLA